MVFFILLLVTEGPRYLQTKLDMHYELNHHPELVNTDQGFPCHRQVTQKWRISCGKFNCENTVKYICGHAEQDKYVED